jgi:hypothetical protein
MKPGQIVKHKRKLIMTARGVYLGKNIRRYDLVLTRYDFVLTFRLTVWGYANILLHFNENWEAI